MLPDLQTCPTCAAPLDILATKESSPDLIFCLYCNSALHLDLSPAAEGKVEVIPSLEPSLIEQARLQLIERNRGGALRLLEEKGHLEHAQAQQATRLLEAQMAIKEIYGRKLGAQGWGLALIVVFLAIGSLAAGLSGQISLPISLGLAIAFLFLLFPFWSGIRTELRLRKAISAPAVLQMYTQTGRYRDLLTFRALIEVQPESQAPFQAQTYLAARPQNLDRLKEGVSLLVRYLPPEQDWVIFERSLEAPQEQPKA